jgi:hypothetical protein
MNLRRTKDLSQYTIAAIDADIGNVHDFYFDDEHWTIRYIVVATGVILQGRKVLISPVALRYPAWTPLHLHVNLGYFTQTCLASLFEKAPNGTPTSPSAGNMSFGFISIITLPHIGPQRSECGQPHSTQLRGGLALPPRLPRGPRHFRISRFRPVKSQNQ